MTPDQMDAGAERLEALAQRKAAEDHGDSGGRTASYARTAVPGEVDVTHGRILYLEDVHVSFDGFKAINGLNLDIAPGEPPCHHGPTRPGQPRGGDARVCGEGPGRGRRTEPTGASGTRGTGRGASTASRQSTG